jgi:hypothetical protein
MLKLLDEWSFAAHESSINQTLHEAQIKHQSSQNQLIVKKYCNVKYSLYLIMTYWFYLEPSSEAGGVGESVVPWNSSTLKHWRFFRTEWHLDAVLITT